MMGEPASVEGVLIWAQKVFWGDPPANWVDFAGDGHWGIGATANFILDRANLDQYGCLVEWIMYEIGEDLLHQLLSPDDIRAGKQRQVRALLGLGNPIVDSEQRMAFNHKVRQSHEIYQKLWGRLGDRLAEIDEIATEDIRRLESH